MIEWEFDSSQPLITPERMLDYYRGLLGAEPEALALPDTLVATFQRLAFDHLAARLGDEAPARWPTPVFWPLARGDHGGRALAATRLPVGAPAAALALELMVAAGVRAVLLVGSAGALQPHLSVGSLVVPTRALRHEGTSHHYLHREEPALPSEELVDALVTTAQRLGLPAPALGDTWTTDAPFRECTDTLARMAAAGVLTVEMEASALFAVARRRAIQMALIVVVSDRLHGSWSPGFHTLAYRRGLLLAADVALDAAVWTR